MEKQKLVKDYLAFDWSLYNTSQTKEKVLFLQLLKELCDTIQEPEHKGKGRKPMPLSDMVFALCLKTYLGFSSRRNASDVRLAVKSRYLSHAMHFNTVLKYFANPVLKPILIKLIEISALPLKQIEQDFAIDATGFSTSLFLKWNDIRRYREQRRCFRKCHAVFGVRTNIITGVEITRGNYADCILFAPLIQRNVLNFDMREISADKAYLSRENLKIADQMDIVPYIPFKSNTNPRSNGSMIWRKMYLYFMEHQQEFMRHYHKRSNAESGFSMIKKRFGNNVKCAKPESQDNEILCKVLCHNICVLIQEMFLNNIDIDFNLCAKTHYAPKYSQ